ncbi:MATE family efflux transporter [Deltaproteobacteria bacterium Smac51]|nr:MATE family efflux transporter [Deltaproteobacteria bacterium Smac51]
MFNNTEKYAARRLLGFSVPIFFTNFLQIFYALTDMAVVGRFVGESGLAAIANGSIIAYLIGSVGTGLAVGGAVVIGHYKGAGDAAGQKESLAAVLILSALAAALISPIGLLYARPIFKSLKIAETILPEAVDYLSIICPAVVLFFWGTTLSFALRSMGDARSPLYFMLVGGLVNVGLDLILVGPCSMGVRGAAVATVAAQGVSLVFSVLYLKKRRFIFDFRLSSFKCRLDRVRRILRIGLPSTGQLLMINLSYMAITILINSYGVTAAAAAGVGIKICTLAVMPCWAVGQSLTALAANSLGAGNFQEAESLGRAALKLNILITLLVVAAIQVWARPLMAFFNPAEPQVITAGVAYLRICCSLGVIMYAAMYTFNSLATGAGAASAAMFNSLLDSVIMRLVLIWVLSRAGYGLTAVFLGQALSAFLPAFLGGVYFYSRLWRRKKVI